MPATVLICALFAAAGCASALAVTAPRGGSELACVHAAPETDVLVGLALSGGGSRAALFAAAGLEALGRMRVPGGTSLLEQVGYISSVSGGSVAAGYYASQKPPRGVPVLTPEGALSDEYQAFFAQFRKVVSHDIEGALIRRQLSTFRWLNSALAAQSLAEVLNERVLGDIRFEDLARREARGDSPRLIVNTTLFNNGRRLVFTTLPPEALRYDFLAQLQQSLASRGLPADIHPELMVRWETLLPVTAEDLRLDLCAIPLAAAVAGSASFPPLVGPITFRVGQEGLYWHTGDGGLYENQGLESVLFPFLRKLQDKRARRALIIAFDSSYPFSVGDGPLTMQAEPFSLFTYDFSRIPSIMEERATAYQALFFRGLQLEGVFPNEQTVRMIRIRHTDAEWRTDLGDLPQACRGEHPPLSSPAAVRERIAEIPTRFWLPSECDRELLVTSAAKAVAQKEQEIREFLAGP